MRATVCVSESAFGSDLAVSIMKKYTNSDFEERDKMFRKTDTHALSLGHLCITWAVLDRAVDALFEPLLQCSDSQRASLVTDMENISSRCNTLTRLLVIEAPSPAYRDWLTALLNRVRTELAPIRNRYIHDLWRVSSEEIIRLDKKAKSKKPQSHHNIEIDYDIKTVTPPDEVDKFNLRVTLVMTMLLFAEFDLVRWRQTGRPLKPHSEYLEATKARARYPSLLEVQQNADQGLPPLDYVFD
jgi:hypothetical protein